MIPVAGVDNVYYTYIETTDPNGNDVSGVTFNNYPDGDSIDTVVTDVSNAQAYDYYEFMSLLGDGKKNITFVIKNTNDTYNENRVATNTNETLSEFNFVQYTDYSNLKTDIFGNNIESIDSELSDSDALYIIQAGNQDLTSAGHELLDGQWYVKCYLYNASGKYLGECYSYELHYADSDIWDSLSAYENQRAYISYEAASSDGTNALRYDGEWYGDAHVSVTVNLAVNVAITTDGGATYEVDADAAGDGVNIATYGSGYINAQYQNVNVTRGESVSITAIPNTGYRFVGWYSADGTLFSTNTTTTVIAAVGTTFTAVFDELEDGLFYVQHYLYTGIGTSEYIPVAHGGTADLYVGIQNVTKGTSAGFSQRESAYIAATQGDELLITIATDGHFKDTFQAWYVDAVDKSGKTTFEEVGVDSLDNIACQDPDCEYYNNGTVIGRTDIVYYQFKYVVQDNDDYSITLYSDLQSISANVTIIYQYEDRYGNVKSYYVPYTLTDEEMAGFEGNGGVEYTPAYISSATGAWVNTVLANAPYVEDYYKDTTWILNEAMYNAGTFTFWATQPDTTYTITVKMDDSVLVEKAPYNSTFKIDARDINPNVGHNGFWYNDIDGNGQYNEGVDIILTYGCAYEYRVYQDMAINYQLVDSLDFNTMIDDPVYGREQSNNSDGSNLKDIVYIDYLNNILTPYFYGRTETICGEEVTFDEVIYDGVVQPELWGNDHVTIETLIAKGFTIRHGFILEQVGTFKSVENGFADGKYATQADALAAAQSAGYGTATDIDVLKDIAHNNSTGMIGGKYYSLFDTTNFELTTKNRLLFTITMNNTAANRAKFFNVYSYLVVTDPAGNETVYISNAQTLNIYEEGVKDQVVQDETLS